MKIEQVKFWVDNVFDSYDDKLNKDEIEEAKRIVNKLLDSMAIKALKQQPCEDAISRQAALEPYQTLDDSDTICVWLLRKNIEQQPPVIPQSKIGHWIFKNDNIAIPTGYYQCSECEDGKLLNKDNYCPNCGARMVSE